MSSELQNRRCHKGHNGRSGKIKKREKEKFKARLLWCGNSCAAVYCQRTRGSVKKGRTCALQSVVRFEVQAEHSWSLNIYCREREGRSYKHNSYHGKWKKLPNQMNSLNIINYLLYQTVVILIIIIFISSKQIICEAVRSKVTHEAERQPP